MFPKESAIMILGKGKKKRSDEDEMDCIADSVGAAVDDGGS